MAREIYYYKRHRSHVRSQTTQGANRDPRRRLRYDEGTGPNLLPDVGVFARAGPSGAPKPKKSKGEVPGPAQDGRRSPAGGDDVAPTNAEGEDVGESSGLAAGGDVSDDGSAAGNEMEQSNEVQSSSPESKKPKICLYVKFKKTANSGEAPGKF